MFILYAKKNQLSVRQREPLTSGSVNIYTIRFEFSPDWDGLNRTAVFTAGGKVISVLLDESGQCSIPWEVLAAPKIDLLAGVYGTLGGNVVLPTIWAVLGPIHEGAAPGEDARPPTPDLWEQELSQKADRMDYTSDGDLGLFSGDKLLSSVAIAGGDGGGGTTDHRQLTHRDAERQHPISAIDGLSDVVNKIPVPTEALTNEELEALLK